MAESKLHLRHKLCNVEGCDNSARSLRADYCEKHYYQIRRNGHLGPKERPAVISHTGGYRLLAAPGHPMARGGFRAYEHRVVFYDNHGEGPFNCHVCGSEVDWGGMHVDHLDDDPTNNAIDNLAAACPTCNQWRGFEKSKRANRLRLTKHWVTWNGCTLPVGEWADELGIRPASLKNRLKKWPLERAMTERRGRFGPKARRRGKGPL